MKNVEIKIYSLYSKMSFIVLFHFSYNYINVFTCNYIKLCIRLDNFFHVKMLRHIHKNYFHIVKKQL